MGVRLSGWQLEVGLPDVTTVYISFNQYQHRHYWPRRCFDREDN